MRTKLLLISVIVCLAGMHLAGQIRRDIPNKNTSFSRQSYLNSQKSAIKSSAKNNAGKTKQQKILSDENNNEDFVLYRDVIRKFGWYVGRGEPISQDLANQLPYYYRLSMKNKAGNYQYMEALHGDSLTACHNISPYIADFEYRVNEISEKNEEWKKHLNSIGQWIMVSDPTGKILVEERAYEAKNEDADLVYAFLPVFNDENHFTGTYIDSWGFPVDMTPQKSDIFSYDDLIDYDELAEVHHFGQTVYVSLDRLGRDSVINFLEGSGLPHFNYNGTGKIELSYYADDNVEFEKHVNAHGINANISNNFQRSYEYNNLENSLLITNWDIRPRNRVTCLKFFPLEFIRCKILFDEKGRESEFILLNNELRDYENDEGIHKVRLNYNIDGNISEIQYFNLAGQKIKSDINPYTL